MIKHIVMWQFNEENKEENMAKAKEKLESLVGKIEGLLTLNIYDNVNEKNEYDLLLETAHPSMEDVNFYQAHPDHKEVSKFIRSVIDKRGCVDFEY